MNNRNKLTMKMDSSFADLLNNSGLILSGRCASTPNDQNRLSLINHLEPNLENTIMDVKKTLTYLDPKIDFAPVPLFGRQNLQLLSDCAKNDSSFTLEKVLNQIEEKADHYLAKPNFENTVSDIVDEEHGKKNSSSLTVDFIKEIKTTKNKDLINSKSKVKKMIKIKSPARSVPIKKRWSILNDNANPVFKILPKCSKSPRLLTAVRARIKLDHERLCKDDKKAGSLLDCFRSPGKRDKTRTVKACGRNLDSISKSSKKVSTEITAKNDMFEMKNEKQSKAHPAIHCGSSSVPGASSKKEYLVKIRATKPAEHKAQVSKQVETEGYAGKEKHVKKLTSSKALPLKKYSPMRIFNKYKITIPESPKLGTRRRMNLHTR